MRLDEAPATALDSCCADQIKAALRGTATFVVLNAEQDGATLEAAIAGVDPDQVATFRIGNPLSAPLSLERAMLQFAPEDDDEDGPVLDEARRLLRAVTARAAGRPCLLVVVEQAETLTASALALLQLLPEVQAPGVARVRVAFVGAPAFYSLLEDPRFHAIRDHGAASPASVAAEPPVPGGAGGLGATPSLPLARRTLGKMQPAILGAASVALAVLLAAALRPSHTPPVGTTPVLFAMLPLKVPASPTTHLDVVPPPLPTFVTAAVPPAQAIASAAEPPAFPPIEASPEAPLQPLASPVVAEDPAAARERVFRDFNAFVEARGLAARLTRSDREALFQEYLVRRHMAAARPSAPAAATILEATAASEMPEVLLFFQADIPGAEALADQNAITLRHQVPNVILRPASDSLSDPVVNYFRPEDRELALAVALALPLAAGDWQVVDMAGAGGRLTRATIEVWLPRPPAAR